ncbi:valine--tRNA ligase [Candidatus Woesearchaeota archaeon]|jgi:valyl-tRNA synthetase|nr:valine--tRNA ligase [Candidatus Woesearchaeota archaeon]MBT7237899.1 valine--tRNA ligase [Candidatus Woesearchaeota archaeon]
MVLAKKYNFKEVEEKWMKDWEKSGIYKFQINSQKKIYSLDIPPPTISGKLHMGHAFGDSLQDFFVRFKRMNGFNILNPFGTDNNGLPTLRLIEKEKNVDSKSMSREKFIELCNKTIKEEFIPMFLKDAKRLGISADWDLFYSTIDERSRRISQESFIDLYKKGREYRIESPSLWCTECQTTIAQVELEDKEFSSFFNDIKFNVDGKDLVIATTRPELLSACVAVFYNPIDKRYKKLKGKMAKVPLFGFEVPIMEDEKVDLEKGTGIVMCCTFGDQTDMEWQKKYKLPIKEAISKDGKLTKISGKYEGLKVEVARKKIIEDLKQEKLLLNQKQINHAVNTHERCGHPVEIITSKQWFIKYLDLKKDMIKWGKEVEWYPSHMKNRYDNWIKGLQWDWSISRQIPFGIPFPVWYCKDCDEVILADEKQLPVDPLVDKPNIKQCKKCKGKEFIPEKDIMNTWATSALTPSIVKDLLKGTPAYDKIKNKPFSVRRSGHDIITFWNFNTIVKSNLHYGKKPWEELLINGWILGKDGKKMSKSRGNVISPQETLDGFGADPLRYLSASAKLGDDVSFSEQELQNGKKLVTKLWNASKFSLMHLEDYKDEKIKLEAIDKGILSKFNFLIKEISESFENYEASKARMILEMFFWGQFCDNYLEIAKDRLYNPDIRGIKERKSAQYTLNYILTNTLKLFAPIIPFITEEIFVNGFNNSDSIHISSWPKHFTKLKDESNEKVWERFVEILSFVRQEKSKQNKSLKEEIVLILPRKDKELLLECIEDLKAVTKAKDILNGRELEVKL